MSTRTPTLAELVHAAEERSLALIGTYARRPDYAVRKRAYQSFFAAVEAVALAGAVETARILTRTTIRRCRIAADLERCDAVREAGEWDGAVGLDQAPGLAFTAKGGAA